MNSSGINMIRESVWGCTINPRTCSMQSSTIGESINRFVYEIQRVQSDGGTHGRRRSGHWTFPLGTAGSPNPWSRASTPRPLSWCHGCSPRQSAGRYLEDGKNEFNHVLTHLRLWIMWPSGDRLTSLEGVLDVVDLHLWSWHSEYALMLKTWWEQRSVCLSVCLKFTLANMDERLVLVADVS